MVTGLPRLLSASSSEERKEILESIAFKNASSAQLNEAEYSPLFFAGLCFLKLRQRNCPLTALLGAVTWGYLESFSTSWDTLIPKQQLKLYFLPGFHVQRRSVDLHTCGAECALDGRER